MGPPIMLRGYLFDQPPAIDAKDSLSFAGAVACA